MSTEPKRIYQTTTPHGWVFTYAESKLKRMVTPEFFQRLSALGVGETLTETFKGGTYSYKRTN